VKEVKKLYKMKRLYQLWFAVVIFLLCFNPTSANALLIQNLNFNITPTSGLHGYTATATVSFNFFRMALWAPDWGTIKFNVELWEDDVDDEMIGIFGGPFFFPGEPDANQSEPVTMTPFSFIPHHTAGMHTFWEGDTIEVYAYIRDMGGTTSFSNVSSEKINVTCVPEPSTLLLLFSGLAGLVGLGRKRLFKKS